MPPSIKPELKSLLFMALEEEWGIVVRDANILKLQLRLKSVRQADPLFRLLSIVISPTDPKNELWIVRSRREQPVEEADAEEI